MPPSVRDSTSTELSETPRDAATTRDSKPSGSHATASHTSGHTAAGHTSGHTSARTAIPVRRLRMIVRPVLVRLGDEAARGDGLPDTSPLADLVRAMRRVKATDRVSIFTATFELLDEEPSLGEGVRAYAARLLRAARVTSAFADLGLLPGHGFFAELRERMTARVLPSRRPPHDLVELLRDIFDAGDALWLDSLDDATIEGLFRRIAPTDRVALGTLAHGTLRAIDLLSHRLAASGEDPSIVLFDPTVVDHDSAFLGQAALILEFTRELRIELGLAQGLASTTTATTDHARVMLRQCRDALVQLRKRAPRTGTTLRMSYDLERLDDVLERLSLLLDTMGRDDTAAWRARITLFRRLVVAHSEVERVMPLILRGSQLIATEIASRAAKTGEHYITRTRREWGHMWLAAGGAGLIVALMACVKVYMAAGHAPPLLEAAMFSANYALGFVLVGALGLTIATKQPAMTAAAIASSIEGPIKRDTRPLVHTIQCLVRSQLAAILANCLVAIPAAFGLSRLHRLLLGTAVASVEKAEHLVAELDPLASFAWPHAALTGLWLSSSGVVAGYVASSIHARHIPERIARSGPITRVFGVRRAARIGAIVGDHGGTIAGSVVLGILLGSTGTFGRLLGLDVDIRHVSFASANLGLALETLGFSSFDIGRTVLGIAGIGALNLSVSFTLSLLLALHARRCSLKDVPQLGRDLVNSLFRDFLAWFFPVGASATATGS